MPLRTVVLTALIAACSSPAPPATSPSQVSGDQVSLAHKPPPPTDTSLVVLTGPRGGNYIRAVTELREHLAGRRANGSSSLTAPTLNILESPGSFYNVEQVGSGRADLGVAQFDAIMVFMAMGGKRRQMANACLAIAPMGYEHVHIIVRNSAHIRGIKDLVGKRLSVGPRHSGSWLSAWSVMFHFAGVDIDEEAWVQKLSYEESLAGLVAGELDAIFMTTAPGMPMLKGLKRRDARLISMLPIPTKRELPTELGYTYAVVDLPPKTYPFQPKAIPTLATRAYLLTNKQAPPGVAALVKSLYAHPQELARSSPLWRTLGKNRVEQDVKSGVPYHPLVTIELGL